MGEWPGARMGGIIHAPLILQAETQKCRSGMRVDVKYCHLSLLITSFYAPLTLNEAYLPK